MITNAIIYMFYLLIYAISSPLRLLNDVVLPNNLADSITTANAYLVSLNFILPVDNLLITLGLILTIEGFIILYKSINWLIRKIPTIN